MPTTRTRRSRGSAGTPTRAETHLSTIRLGVPSDRRVAEILGVSPSQVSRWRKGQAPDPEHADRLAGLALVVEMLERWLPAEVIEEWLLGANAHLGGRSPAYALRHGQLGNAVAAVEALKSGVFA